jgi:hypothetical protein
MRWLTSILNGWSLMWLLAKEFYFAGVRLGAAGARSGAGRRLRRGAFALGLPLLAHRRLVLDLRLRLVLAVLPLLLEHGIVDDQPAVANLLGQLAAKLQDRCLNRPVLRSARMASFTSSNFTTLGGLRFSSRIRWNAPSARTTSETCPSLRLNAASLNSCGSPCASRAERRQLPAGAGGLRIATQILRDHRERIATVQSFLYLLDLLHVRALDVPALDRLPVERVERRVRLSSLIFPISIGSAILRR